MFIYPWCERWYSDGEEFMAYKILGDASSDLWNVHANFLDSERSIVSYYGMMVSID